MKKLIAIMAISAGLAACSNSSEVPATQNDGIHVTDSDGGLADTGYIPVYTAPVDSEAGEHRVDISKRDTFQ